MPEYIADMLLSHAMNESFEQCENLPWFNELDDVRKRVIVNMVFNMGMPTFKRFKNN